MNNPVLIYDINTCPSEMGVTMDVVCKLFKEQQIVIYDGILVAKGEAQKPEVVDLPLDMEVTYYDVSKEEDRNQLKLKLE